MTLRRQTSDRRTTSPPRGEEVSLGDLFSVDAERSVLGAILVHNDAFNSAVQVIAPEDFYRDAHRRIFGKMIALNERNQAIDFVTLKEELARTGDLDEVGGPAYIASLADGVPRATNIEYYARIVRDRARARAVVITCRQAIAAIGADPAVAVTGFAGELGTRIQQLATGVAPAPPGDLVLAELDRARARLAAQQQLGHEARGPIALPAPQTLEAWLEEPEPVTRWRIDGWQPVETRVMLIAAAKCGKTTAIGSLIRSLVDGDPWLGQPVTPIDGRVVLLDAEMSPPHLRRWLRDQQIRRTDCVVVAPLRGRLASFDVLDAGIRARWATWLRDVGARYVILDCLRPVMDALGLDEHREAGRLLTAVDALLVEADIPEATVVHHMGHTGERARGDSRLRDWPDVEWRMMRHDQDPASPRYIAAYGRDVDVPESQLAYDATTRRLTLIGGSRQAARTSEVLDAIIAAIQKASAPLNGRDLKTALRGRYGRDAIDAALKTGKNHKDLLVEAGPYRSQLYRIGPSVLVSGSVLPVSVGNSPESVSVCPTPPMGGDTSDTHGIPGGSAPVSRVQRSDDADVV